MKDATEATNVPTVLLKDARVRRKDAAVPRNVGTVPAKDREVSRNLEEEALKVPRRPLLLARGRGNVHGSPRKLPRDRRNVAGSPG